MKIFPRFRDERGQGFVEYIFIIGLVAIFCFIVISIFGQKVNNSFQKAAQKVEEATKW